MVSLGSQAFRESINIDTIERGLVYAFLMLRSAIVTETNAEVANQKIRIAENVNTLTEAFLILEAELSYNAFLASKNGGQIMPYITEFSNAVRVEPDYDCPPSVPSVPLIPNTPSFISSVEQYLYWCSSVLVASSEANQRNIEIQRFEHNIEGAFMKVIARLPFNYQAYLLGENYICAVARLATDYETYTEEQLTLLDNSTFIDNSFVLEN